MNVKIRRIEPTTAEPETWLGSPWPTPDNVWEEDTERADFSPRPLGSHGRRLWFGMGLMATLIATGFFGRVWPEGGAAAQHEAAAPEATPAVELPFSIIDPAAASTIEGATIQVHGDATEPVGTIQLDVVVGGAVVGWATIRVDRSGPWAASIPVFAPPVRVEAQLVASHQAAATVASRTAPDLGATASIRRPFYVRSGGPIGLWPASIRRSGGTTVISVGGSASVGLGTVTVRLTGQDGPLLPPIEARVVRDEARPGGAGGYALGLGSFMATFSVRDPIRAGPVRAAVDWRDDIGGAWGTAMLTIIPSGPNRAERP